MSQQVLDGRFEGDVRSYTVVRPICHISICHDTVGAGDRVRTIQFITFPIMGNTQTNTGLLQVTFQNIVIVALGKRPQEHIAVFGQFILRRSHTEQTDLIVRFGVIDHRGTDRDLKPVIEERLAERHTEIVRCARRPFVLTAADIDIHQFASLGISHRSVDTAVDDTRQRIAVIFGSYVTLTHVHSRCEQHRRHLFPFVLIQRCQFFRHRLVGRCLQEETYMSQIDRVQNAFDPHTGGKIHRAHVFPFRLHVCFHFLRSRHIEHRLTKRSLESDMTTGINMERHDGVYLRRVADKTGIDVDLSAEVQCPVCRTILHVHCSVGFDLRQVLLIDRIRDICHRQNRHIDICQNTVQRACDTTADVRCQLSIDRQWTAFR